MDNQDEGTTIINVKGVRKSSWNRATQAASLRKDPYGAWLSDTIDFRLEMEAKGIEAPGKAGQSSLSPDQMTARLGALAELAKGLAALKSAGARPVGISALSRGLALVLAEMPAANPMLRIGRFGQSGGNPPLVVLEDQAHE